MKIEHRVFRTMKHAVGSSHSKSLDQGLAHYSLWDKRGPLLVFVNNVLLDRSHDNLFCATMAERSTWSRLYRLQSLKSLLSGLSEKKFANPCSRPLRVLSPVLEMKK